MDSWVDTCIKELEQWEQSVYSFLLETHSAEEIEYYLAEIHRDVKGLYDRVEKKQLDLARSNYNAIASLYQIRPLLTEVKKETKKRISVEIAARYAVLLFRAGIYVGMHAPGRVVEKFEPLAKTRLAQIKNQPPTRTRKTVERDDIEVHLDAYECEKNFAPPSLDHLLTYLDRKGYIIDHTTKTVMSPVGAQVCWHSPRKFGTLQNWLRNFKNPTDT
jgi:hypothetical protein